MYTAPTGGDLQALQNVSTVLSKAVTDLGQSQGLVDLVTQRLSVVAPPARPTLPAVGIGGSGAFGGLPRAERQKLLALARAAGLTHFRTDCQWANIETVKGKYNLRGIVERCQDIVAAGLIPQVLVGWTPTHYRAAGSTAGANSAPTGPGALVAWEAFLRALLPALYAVGVRRIEVWNEPNFLFMQPVSPGVWADLVATAHAVACDVSRHFVIIAGGVCPAVDKPPKSMGASLFYDAVLDYMPSFFDVVDEVGIHPYAGDHTKLLDGQFWTKHVAYLRTIVPAEVPLCGTEHGWKSVKNTEAERAQLYVDSIVTLPDQRAPLFLFSLFDFAELYGIVTKDGTPKPVYHALQSLLTT